MNALRIGGSSLFLTSFLGAVCWLVGGSSGCSGIGGDIWECEDPDGGHLTTIPVGHPSLRPADCPCATGGPVADGNGKTYVYPQGNCPGIDAGADGSPIPSGSGSSSSGSATCDAACIPGAPDRFFGARLLWIGGTAAEAPECPSGAAGDGYEGHGGLVAGDASCSCVCTQSAGSCALPSTITTSTAACPGAGAPSPFDGPPGWDGGCTTIEATAGDVGSVTAAALVEQDVDCSCAPVNQDQPWAWTVFARSCFWTTSDGTCASTGETCAPIVPGFHYCVSKDGDEACPDAGYSEKHVFYDGAMDGRTCTDCTVTTSPGTCATKLYVYENSTCAPGTDVASETLTSDKSTCFDIDDVPLKSKALGPVAHEPGTCGGTSTSTGSITPTGAATYCCLPSPGPTPPTP